MNMVIKVRADSETDLAAALRNLADHVAEGDATGGGFGCWKHYGYNYTVVTDEQFERFKLRHLRISEPSDSETACIFRTDCDHREHLLASNSAGTYCTGCGIRIIREGYP